MTIPFVDLQSQYASVKDEVDQAIARVVEGGEFILGAEVEAFEHEFAGYCGVKYTIGVASGSDALLLSLLGLGVGAGDEVITTPFTFIATAEAIVRAGASPVFVDIDPITYNLDIRQIQGSVTSRTRAILPVHLYGRPAPMAEICQIAAKHGIKIVEDCAQSLGAEYNGRKAGTIGDVGCFSFFPTKNLGAYGDGGMVITDDPALAEKVRSLRVHGRSTNHQYTAHGLNSRLDALQAAILRVKLRYIERWNELRRTRARAYTSLLSQVRGIMTPASCDGKGKESCNYYTIRISEPSLSRDILHDQLNARGIQARIYYPLSIHLYDSYRYLGYELGNFPQSERAQAEVLSLPIYPEMADGQVSAVATEVKEAIGRQDK